MSRYSDWHPAACPRCHLASRVARIERVSKRIVALVQAACHHLHAGMNIVVSETAIKELERSQVDCNSIHRHLFVNRDRI